MFENRRMPNGTSEPSLGLCGVGGRARKDSLYPICRIQDKQQCLSYAALNSRIRLTKRPAKKKHLISNRLLEPLKSLLACAWIDLMRRHCLDTPRLSGFLSSSRFVLSYGFRYPLPILRFRLATS